MKARKRTRGGPTPIRLQVMLDPALAKELDDLTEERFHANRSMAITEAVRRLLADEQTSASKAA
ncbi:MAG: ribbon-helix-helix domain-containing protein [Acidimicrobiales bacterium]